MRIIKTVFFILLFPILVICQTNKGTTLEEYNYVSKGYKIQIDSGLDMKKGYSFEEYGIFKDTRGVRTRQVEFKGLFRDGEDEPCAYLGIFEKKGTNRIFHVCVPNAHADFSIWDKFSTDFRKITPSGELQVEYVMAVFKFLANRSSQSPVAKNNFGTPIGGLFGNSSGNGETIGIVSGGLSSRGVLNAPQITINAQHQGRIVLKVCVNKFGQVTSAEYTQKGSTTTDSRLREIAVNNAKSWLFNKGTLDKQCGTMSYDFKAN